jgi:hypothetical protein
MDSLDHLYGNIGIKTGSVRVNVTLRRVRVTTVAASITYSECVCSFSYSACKAHAPYYIVICGMPGSTMFFHIISFSEKKLLNVKGVLIFSAYLSETVLISGRVERDILIHVHRSSCEVPVIFVAL